MWNRTPFRPPVHLYQLRSLGLRVGASSLLAIIDNRISFLPLVVRMLDRTRDLLPVLRRACMSLLVFGSRVENHIISTHSWRYYTGAAGPRVDMIIKN
jgi:hypothetical protein